MTTGVAWFLIATRNPGSATLKAAAELGTVIPLAVGFFALRRRIAQGGRQRWAAVAVVWTVTLATRVVLMTGVNYVLVPAFFPPLAEFILALLVPLALFNLAQGALNIVAAQVVVDRLAPDLKPEWWASPSGEEPGG